MDTMWCNNIVGVGHVVGCKVEAVSNVGDGPGPTGCTIVHNTAIYRKSSGV
jgi:hypothetical protein